MKKIKFAKVKAALKGKGFIFALALSIAAVGAATYYAYDSVMNGFGEGELTDDGLVMGVDKNQPDVPKDTTSETAAPAPSATTPAESSNESTSESETQAANNFFTAKTPRTLPVEGEIIKAYSDGELVKSETLNLWQTHDGIDIAAAMGTEVKAAGEGSILNVWEDPLWGVCLSIDHGDGYVSTVCGLDSNVPVSVGQEVECGDIIGKVGNVPECECALDPHLHFEVKKDGNFVSPLSFAGEQAE